MNFGIGDTVGGYEIVGVLGSGGMGEVYRVRNVISDRVDAMKVLLARLQREQDFASRFIREIKLQARLVHPNIAQLYTAFEHQGNLMMILELVDGVNLMQMLDAGRVPLASAVDYTSQALNALSYAHAQGVIHRDIKPGNIMVTRAGVVKLMDFGIAKAATDHSLTVTGNLIGSLYYMSPEQVRAEAIDHRSDLYSVGVVLYQMATGRKPFEGDSEYKIMQAQVEHVPPPPSAIDATVPERLSQIILRALAKDRNERFQTGEEFREALRQVAGSLQEGASAREGEIGATRMMGAALHAPAVPREAQEASTAPREPLPERRETGPAAGAIPRPGTAQAAPAQDKQPRRSRSALWVGAGVAAAVLAVAGTQIHDWLASAKPARTAAVAPAIDLQTPGSPSPQQQAPGAGAEPAAAARPSSVSQGNVPKEIAAQPLLITGGSGGGVADNPASPPSAPPKAASKSSGNEASVPPSSPRTEAASSTAPNSRAASGEPRPGSATPAASHSTSEAKPAAGTSPSTTPPAAGAAASSAPPLVAHPPAGQPPAPDAAAQPGTPAPAAQAPDTPPPATPAPVVERIYTPNEVDVPPKLVRQVQPRYTEAAQKARVQGKVRLSAEIWPDGRAHNIQVLQSVGHADLDRNAMAALSLWQFVPGRKDGVAVKVRAVIDQTYRLQGSKSTPALSKDQ